MKILSIQSFQCVKKQGKSIFELKFLYAIDKFFNKVTNCILKIFSVKGTDNVVKTERDRPTIEDALIKMERKLFFLGTFSPNMRSWYPTYR